MDAARNGNAIGIQDALKAGADPNCRLEPGNTTALMLAVTNGSLAAVEALLARKANPDAQDGAGATALMFAAQLGKIDLVRALLKRGARAQIVAKNGATAGELAKNEGHDQIARLLAKAKK